ncbi:hypothetical protein [Sediminibacterium sp. C3]|uniref:hypothetical protein n=1 Tax=Sediminibacterium sp. C3 TaxID=1267211 RepID=UPI000403043F|nr:hypothetical protein [Sediminibacterium sp. C3]
MKKELILIGTTWPFRSGGIASFNERLAREFQAQGYTVTIYTFSLQYPSFYFQANRNTAVILRQLI